MKKGILQAAGAYMCWGLFPIFWKQLYSVDVVQVISHRIIWSFATLLIALVLLSKLGEFRRSAFSSRVILMYAASAILIGINWLVYIWGVNSGHIVETSLGYFINPLINVLFGIAFFKENLRSGQWIAIGLAACGVVFLSVMLGQVPWIAIFLSVSFGMYGAVKKVAPLNALSGLMLETSILFVPALLFLLAEESKGVGSFAHSGTETSMLLIVGGFITTIPLLLFASAVQKIPLTIMGILQYLAPTLQLLCGIFIYHEVFSSAQFIGYVMVWLALIILGVEGAFSHQSKKVPLVE